MGTQDLWERGAFFGGIWRVELDVERPAEEALQMVTRPPLFMSLHRLQTCHGGTLTFS